MIVVRSPLRITLGGGATDVPSYYERFGGFTISAAINKYVYIVLHKNFTDELIVKYSQTERVLEASSVQHPIVREAMLLVGERGTGLDIASFADVPAGTGLGSSSSFTAALCKALLANRGTPVGPDELAELACKIEIERLEEPIGKQDQYTTTHGGVRTTTYRQGTASCVEWTSGLGSGLDLERRLFLFRAGTARRDHSILKQQVEMTNAGDAAMLAALHEVKANGVACAEAIKACDWSGLAGLMNEHWELKKKRSTAMTSPEIERCRKIGLANGAMAARLVGAGSGGFMMFLSERPDLLTPAMRETGHKELEFKFDYEGTKVIHHD